MEEILENNGFTKVDGLDKWFINFQGRTYYVFMDGGKWWITTNKNGFDIFVNQVGFTTFKHVQNLLNSITLGSIKWGNLTNPCRSEKRGVNLR